MKKAEDQLKVIPNESTSIPQWLGIPDDRFKEVIKRVQSIVKEEITKGDGNNAKVIVAIYNEFENPAECAFALYALQHEEEEVLVHETFRLPENVAEEVKS